MANRTFQQFSGTLEKGVVKLYARVSVGVAGAVTLKKWNGSTRTYSAAAASGSQVYAIGWGGIKTVTRTGTGAWTIVLQDSYQRVLDARFVNTATSGVSTVVAMSMDATSDVTSNTAPTIKVLFSNATATAADPASGDEINLTFELQNSSAL